MPNNEIAITFGKFNPPHLGHHALVKEGVIDYANNLGIDHTIYTSSKHLKPTKAVIAHKDAPLNPEKKVTHLKRFFQSDNVKIGSDPYSTIEDLISKGYSKIHVVLGSDRVDDTGPALTERYGDKIKIVPYGQKRSSNAEGVAGASSTKMRTHASNNDFESFRRLIPTHVSDEHARELFDDVRSGLRLAKIDLHELVSPITRQKLARAARRTSKRRAILRKARQRRRRNLPQLRRRAKNEVKDTLRRRLTGRKPWKKISYSQRAQYDKSIARRKKIADAMVKRIMPSVIRGEGERLRKLNNSFDPIIDNFITNFLSEAKRKPGKDRTPTREPKTGTEKLKRKNQNRNNQRNTRARTEDEIKSGNVKGNVFVVRNKDGDLEIVDKKSLTKGHTIVVDAEQASTARLQAFLNDKDFVNTKTSEKLFGFIGGSGGSTKSKKAPKEEKPKAKSQKKEKGPSKEQKLAQKQMMPQEPGEWDLEEGTIEPTRKQSKNCSFPTSHDAKIVEPAMAVFANAANGIDFKKQVEMGLVDEDVMKAILKSPHKSLHESAQRMGNALVNHYGQRVYFKVVGSKLEDVKLSKKAEEGGLTNKTSKADVHIFNADTNELIDTASVKCGASQASSGNWQDSTVGLQWTLDNANNFGITLSKNVVKEVENLISFISDPNEYAGNEVTARGPTNLYKARGAFAGQDPTFTKKEKANKTLTDKMNKLFESSPEVLALYALTQMTGFHKFEENSTAIARSMIAVSHDGTQVKIGQIDLDLAKKLKIDIASRIKSSSAASKAQELEWDSLQEQAKKSGKKLTDVDDFRPYGYRNTIRITINEVDLRTLKESKSPLTSMSGVSIFKLLTEDKKKDSKFYNVGMSPEEVEQNLKDLKEISKEDPMQVFQIVNSAFDYDDNSPKVDFLDILPTEGYTVNRVYVNGKEFTIPVEIPYNYPIPGMQIPQVSLEEQNLFERNYRKEYDNYHSRPEQRKNRSKRVLARRLMMKLGRVKKGDGKDVDHKDGNPQNNGKHNLRVRSKSENRADND